MKPNLSSLLCLLALSGSATAGGGDVLWHFEIDRPDGLHRPTVAADGTIYWSNRSLYALTPAGQVIWERPYADTNPVGIGFDGTLYVGGKQPPPNEHLPALKAFSPAGVHLWDFFDFGLVIGFIGGPNVGPDGNVYAVTWGGTNPNPPGFGAFSLTPGGSLRWHVDGFAHQMAGTEPSEIVFGNGNMYKSESNAPMPSSELQSGIVALELDGDIAWRHSIGIPSNSPSRQPCVSPLNGNVHLRVPTRTLRTYDPSGNQVWYYNGAYTALGFGAPAVGPDGSVYVINGSRHVIALDAAGAERWIAQDVISNTALAPEVSPDGSMLVFGIAACNGGACPGRIMGMRTSDGSVLFDKALPYVPGGLPTVTTQPRFSNDGSIVYVGAEAFTTFTKSYLFAISVQDAWQPYCTAKTASIGCTPAISATGIPGPGAGAPFVVRAAQIPSQQLGILFYGLNGPAAVPFQGGTLCVTAPVKRTPHQSSTGNSPPSSDCSGTFALDFDAFITTGIDPSLTPGSTVHAQFWFRDPGDPFGTGLTNGIRFLIQP